MYIRKTREEDLPRVLAIYAEARRFMAAHGNPNQWGPTGWPPEALIRQDTACGKGHVCVDKEEVVGTFFYDQGRDIEPAYRIIHEGSWSPDEEYGVVHRLATDGSLKGIGSFCLAWALEQCGYLRIDTHPDNKIMQALLHKLGFVQRGIIHVEEDNYPRLAYEGRLEGGL